MTALTCTLEKDGAQLFSQAATDCLPDLFAALAGLPPEEAGTRLHGIQKLNLMLGFDGCIGTIVSRILGRPAKPVRAILFNKTLQSNWGLGWHQDRTICVRKRLDAEGFGPWSVKQGMLHVAPPFELLAQMITLRVHLDDVPETNAPLLVAPGSHMLGRIAVHDIAEAVKQCGTQVCLAKAGDIWAYSTPILHASDASKSTDGRRVLQVDYATFALPKGLEWLGI
jgi:hypothetical protein